MSSTSTGSVSYQWDNSGAELAQQRGDELSKLAAQQAKSLTDGDVGAALAQRRRIKDLQRYINAYQGGGDAGPYPEVFAGKRAGSMSSSESSTSSPQRE
jgi:hypothetical protein